MPNEAHTHNVPFIKVEGLTKRYRDDLPPVFENINFSIQQGEFICVIGHSGCGKSTILNVIAGLEEKPCIPVADDIGNSPAHGPDDRASGIHGF